MALTDADLAAAPLWRFGIKNNGPQLIKAWHHKNVSRLQGLSYGDPYSHPIDAIYESKYIHNLQSLSMWNTSVKNSTIEALCGRAADLPHLSELNFEQTRVTDPGLKRLTNSPLMERLRTLTVGYNDFSVSAIEELAASPAGRNLRHLEIDAYYRDQSSRESVETRAHNAILGGRHWTKLNRFQFDINNLDRLLEVMRTAKPVFQLRHVVIDLQYSDRIAILERILQSPLLKDVRELGLWCCEITIPHAEMIAASPVLGPLRKLDIRYADADRVRAQKIIWDRFGRIDTPMMS